jgi:hypothetical protein
MFIKKNFRILKTKLFFGVGQMSEQSHFKFTILKNNFPISYFKKEKCIFASNNHNFAAYLLL